MEITKLAAACLSFDHDTSRAACEEWASLSERQQRAMLDFGDPAGLSLYLWRTAQAAGVSERLRYAAEYRERRRKNEIRLAVRRRTAAELAAIFAAAGLTCVILKGFFLAPDFVPDATDRLQNDIDLFFSPDDAQTAFDLLLRGGYRAVGDESDGPAMHLPMLLPVDFTDPQGDCFNPATQPAVELHHYLWRSEWECISITFDPNPLSRIVQREGLPTLHPHDQLATVTLHAMRHVFRGSLRVSHLYELAGFLHARSDDETFWRTWISDVNAPLRRLCTACLALAAHLYDCSWPLALEEERRALPATARDWIERYGHVVLDNPRRDKLQLFLQLAFVEGWRNRVLVLQRRLAPLRIPDEVSPTPLRFPQRVVGRVRMVSRRAIFHVMTFFKFLRTAAELWL